VFWFYLPALVISGIVIECSWLMYRRYCCSTSCRLVGIMYILASGVSALALTTIIRALIPSQDEPADPSRAIYGLIAFCVTFWAELLAGALLLTKKQRGK
jgi:hypothetical protein